ncbi:MAG TPA: tetratricopeptide repeat protein [Novimethylophilus sp.]|uniref:tetratricopeptide repeat protein n=1 Tax=Novimethylophilus sp. TaxID=2137426 RepID=UPI002F42B1D4
MELSSMNQAWRMNVGVRMLMLAVLLPILGGLILADFNRRLSVSPSTGALNALHSRQKIAAEVRERFRQGVVMLHAKRYDDAITAFHRVIELEPEMPEAHVNMGYALIGLQRYEAARDFFEGATALRRDQVNAYYGLAEALEGMHDLPGAIGAMRTYLHLAPAGDQYRRKAEAAIWEWQEALKKARNETPGSQPTQPSP